MFQSGDFELIPTSIDRVYSEIAAVCSVGAAAEAAGFEVEEEELQLVAVVAVATVVIVAVAVADWAAVAHSAGQEVPAAPVGPSRCSATKPFGFDTG